MELNQIIERISEIACKHCSNYPNIKTAQPWEQLYAIESTLLGITKANDDCHAFIAILRKKLNMTDEDVYALWEEITES